MRDAAIEPTPGPNGRHIEVAVQASTRSSALRREGKGKAKAEVALVRAHTKAAQAIPLKTQNILPPALLLQIHCIVMHAAPLHYKPATMREWIEEDNKDVGRYHGN